VIAYEAGGPAAAGILGAVRYLPHTILAPFAGLPTERWAPHRVLFAVDLLRALCIAATLAILVIGGPLWLVFVIVAIEAGVGGLTRPLTLSLVPWLARTPGELVASNVVTSAAEGVGTVLGPTIVGILLAVSGAAGATAAAAAMMAVGILAVASIRVTTLRTRPTPAAGRPGWTDGLRTIARIPVLRLVILGFALQSGVRGMLNVLLVVVAIERLGIGNAGVGLLSAAIGAGSFVGALIALSLTGRNRVSSVFIDSLAMWGLPIVVIGLVADPIAAVAMLVIVGVSNALLDVTGFTLLQRFSPNTSRVAVMGALDSLGAAGLVLGSLAASLVLAWLGIQAALFVAGVILPLTAVLSRPGLQRGEAQVDVNEEPARLLQDDRLFVPLSLSVIEELAATMRPIAFEPDQYLIREGEAGNDYILVAEGDIEVSQAGSPIRRLGPGAGVGEISLLRDVPRTASVRAVGPVRAYALECEAFLLAVTGTPASLGLAEAIVEDRLTGSPSSTAPA
jgi:predicted MFS family arabinose efflux permease